MTRISELQTKARAKSRQQHLETEWKLIDLTSCPDCCRLKTLNYHKGPPLYICQATKAINCPTLINRHDLNTEGPMTIQTKQDRPKPSPNWRYPNVQET